MSLIQKRISLARNVGRIKQKQGLPVRNFQVEKRVLQRVERYATEFSLDDSIAKSIYNEIIKASVNVQLESHTIKNMDLFKQCLVYGGNGTMGRWMVHFLRSSGHQVDIIDPSLDQSDVKELDSYDFIILATPLSLTKKVLDEIINQRPKGIIFDIASLKSKLIPSIMQAQEEGLKVSSVHPMFGPDVISLEDRNLVICETNKSKEINEEIADLFKETSVNLIYTQLNDHDDYMSYSLGLSHFLNLLFGKILGDADHNFEDFQNFAGTTFFKQLETTKEVFSENPTLYFAIQKENDYTPDLYHKVLSSCEQLMQLILNSSPDEFSDWMKSISDFLGNREI